MIERRLLEALGGLPRVLSSAPPHAREHACAVLWDSYVQNALPRAFVDGTLLLAGHTSGQPYPTWFHAARLLQAGASSSAVRAWLSLEDSWRVTALVEWWQQRADAPPLEPAELADPESPTAGPLARTITLMLLEPARVAGVRPFVARALGARLSLAVSHLGRVWTEVHMGVSVPYVVPTAPDPVIDPHRCRLEALLTGHLVNEWAGPESLTETVLGDLPIGVICLDRAGRVVYRNPAMAQIMCVPADAPLPPAGTLLADSPFLKASGLAERVRQLVENGAPLPRCRFRIKSLASSHRTLCAHGRSIVDGRDQQIGSVLVVADVTRDVELERQRVDAQKAELLVSSLESVARDLATPIGQVRDHSARLRAGLAPCDPCVATVERLDEATNRLAAAVDGLVTLARGRGELAAGRVDAGDVLRLVAPLIEERLPANVTLTVTVTPGPLPCAIGKAHLEQVIVSLCVHARDAIQARSTNATGQIMVRGYREDATPPTCCIEITDDGIGMDSAGLSHAFEPLFAAGPQAAATGLALPVSRAVVEAHHGTLTCSSRPGAGSTFLVMLPLSAPAATPELTPAGVTPKSAVTARVLVVEDNEVVRTLCVELLLATGSTAEAAETGEGALALLSQRPDFDLALVDVELPDMDGVALAARMGPMPVVLMSGAMPPDLDERLASQAGARHFVKKPFDIPNLLALIDATIRG